MPELTADFAFKLWQTSKGLDDNDPQVVNAQIGIQRWVDIDGNIIESTNNMGQLDSGLGMAVLDDSVSVMIRNNGQVVAGLAFDHNFVELERDDPQDLIAHIKSTHFSFE